MSMYSAGRKGGRTGGGGWNIENDIVAGIAHYVCCHGCYIVLMRRDGIQTGDKEARMDERELHYDADGGFIMIDMQEGLMGVYYAVKPVRHIWKKKLKRLTPGVYKLSICDGWVELYNDELHGVYVIGMNEKDNRFFLREVEQDIPVLVY